MKLHPITRTQDGRATWTQQAGDKYVVTGRDCNGKRFRHTTASWLLADSVNVWSGTVWLVRDGKRFVVRRTSN